MVLMRMNAVDYLYRTKGQSGTAAALLVLYFLFFILSIACYLRTFLTVQFDPALVPLTPERETRKTSRRRHRGRGRDIESEPWVPPDSDPDSPGLESFYSKDVFICQSDGRPKWCSDCRQWKPDRVSHSSELQRCVRKMDHLCPWAGGMVSETCKPVHSSLRDGRGADSIKRSISLCSSSSTVLFTAQFA